MKFLISLMMLCSVLGCKHAVIIDRSLAAIDADDPTAPIKIEGCGAQSFVSEGFAYCRKAEGPVGNEAITFVAPPTATNCDPHTCDTNDVSCNAKSCVDFKIFFPDLSPAYGDFIEFGKVAKTVPWKVILKKDTFSVGDRGFWPYVYTIRWKDKNKRNHITVMDGEIRLRVYRTSKCDVSSGECLEYTPLRNIQGDSNFVWIWSMDGQMIKITTAGRVYVSQKE